MKPDARSSKAGTPASSERTDFLRRLVPWTLLWLYAACCVIYCADAWWRPDWDGAVYLLTGKSLAAGEGYRYLGEPFFMRPPGLPLLLSLFLEDGEYDFRAMNLVLLAFAGLTVTMIFLALRPLHGVWIALGVALLTGTSKLFTHFFNFALAEYPYFTVFFLGVILHQVSVRTRTRWWLPALLGALCFTLAVHLRTAAVLAWAGIALASLLRCQGRQRLSGPLLALVTVVLMLPWLGYSRWAAAQATVPVEQELQFDYTTAMLHADPGDPGSPWISGADWLRRIHQNGELLLDELVLTSFHIEGSGWLSQALLCGLVAVGLLICLRRGSLLYECLTITFALFVLCYFAYGSRLLTPLVPMVYLYFLVVATALCRALGERLRQPRITPLICGLAFGLLLYGNVENFRKHMLNDSDPAPTYRQLADWIQANTAVDAVLLCNQAPIVSLLSHRTAYTFRFPRSPDLIEKYRPDYVILDGQADPSFVQQVTKHMQRRLQVTTGSGVRIAVYQMGPGK